MVEGYMDTLRHQGMNVTATSAPCIAMTLAMGYRPLPWYSFSIGPKDL